MTMPHKDREVWFSLEENHEMASRSGRHQLRNCPLYNVEEKYTRILVEVLCELC
jgi:hypothetical protein